MNRKNIAVADVTSLLNIPSPRDDASVACLLTNLSISMRFKSDEPVAKDEFWHGVDTGESQQWNRERAAQHAQQARFKAAQQQGGKLELSEDKEQ